MIRLLPAALLLTAYLLTPNAAGHGTHMALGLPACPFLSWTGLPCPTCGLTTAFAHLAHGEVMRSISVHPMGLPLFALCFVALLKPPPLRLAPLLVIALLITWLAKLSAFALDVVPARQVELLQLADQVAAADA